MLPRCQFGGKGPLPLLRKRDGDYVEEVRFGHTWNKSEPWAVLDFPTISKTKKIESVRLDCPGVWVCRAKKHDTIVDELQKVLELEQQGNRIKSVKWDMTQKVICAIGVAFALNYLHERKIVHGDVSPANIELVKDSSFGVHPSLGGFYNAFHSSEILAPSMLRVCPEYPAPEMDEDLWGKSSDVFSYGMLLYTIFANRAPFNEKGEIGTGLNRYSEALEKILMNERPKSSSIPRLINDIIERCWCDDYRARANMTEIISDYFRKESWQQELSEEIELRSRDIKKYVERISKVASKRRV